MKVSIYSRKEIEKIIKSGNFPENTVVISYYDPTIKRIDKDYTHVDYDGVCNDVFFSELDDLDLSILEKKAILIIHISLKPLIWLNLSIMYTITAWI